MTVVIIIVVVVVLLILAGAVMYNGLVRLNQQASEAWSDITVQLKRRADLIPNLVNTVKGYAAQEKSVLIGVTDARARATQVQADASITTDPAKFRQFEQTQNQLGTALSRLLVVQERYPELKSNENFLTLQAQLEGTENR
ncbi:MAG TPA: LemA family protein, partial [Candidatus Saccharimonadales bacterium]|nr:LemA family protein [Candidatus Saccharimonadales bacterium]